MLGRYRVLLTVGGARRRGAPGGISWNHRPLWPRDEARQGRDRGTGWRRVHLPVSRAGKGEAIAQVTEVTAIKVALSTASVFPERTPDAFETAARLGYDGARGHGDR